MSVLGSKHFFTLIILSAVAIAICGFSTNYHFLSKLHGQIEITTDKVLEFPIFNETQNEQSLLAPKILYSSLSNDTLVGEVLNNFSYPIELVSITATVYDKNGIITASGEKYVNDYVLKPGVRSGFDIYLNEPLPGSSKYILTTSFEKSDDNKPEALLLSVGKNYKHLNSFRVLGEVINHGQNAANAVKVSGIFYDSQHKVIDADYVYTNPDIISPNKKAPFEFSFYVNNPERIKSMAFNVQSDEYSLITNTTQNKTK
jgi:hypothetical protein